MSPNPTEASAYDRLEPPPFLTDAELARIDVATATPYELVRVALDGGVRKSTASARWDEDRQEWRQTDSTVTRADLTMTFLEDVLAALRPIDESAWFSLRNHIDLRRWPDDGDDEDLSLDRWEP